MGECPLIWIEKYQKCSHTLYIVSGKIYFVLVDEQQQLNSLPLMQPLIKALAISKQLIPVACHRFRLQVCLVLLLISL